MYVPNNLCCGRTFLLFSWEFKQHPFTSSDAYCLQILLTRIRIKEYFVSFLWKYLSYNLVCWTLNERRQIQQSLSCEISTCIEVNANCTYTSSILWKVYNKLTKVLSASRSGELSKVQTHALSRLHWSSARVASVAYASPLRQFGTDR